MQFNAFCEGVVALSQQLYYALSRQQHWLTGRDTTPVKHQPFTGKLLTGILIVLITGFQASAEVRDPAAKITLTKKNAALQEVFRAIQKQTGYTFAYNTEMMQQTKRVSIDVKEVSLDHVLSICFRDQPLTYSIVDKIIVIQKKQNKIIDIDTTQSPNIPSLLNVKGKVMDEQSNPVIKASITIKSTRKLTITDNKGEFSLENVPDNATLLISCVGFIPKEIRVNGNENIITQLKVAINNLDETVVVAYNTTTKRANTGAVTVVKGEQIATLPNRSFDKSLQGLVPGLLVTGGNGQPGGAPSQFILRGIASGGTNLDGSTVRNPLVVIDGIPVAQDPPYLNVQSGTSATHNPMAHLNPSDIESISVLKDAAAVALYGSKASNGVLLITTKKGKVGKTTFSFRHQTDITERLKEVPVLNQQEYLSLMIEAYHNSYPGITDAEILSDLRRSDDPLTSVVFPTIIKSPGDTSFYPQDDWKNAVYKKNAATISNELTISGGNDRSTFYLNLEFSKQNGVVRNTGFDRKSVRFNYENRVTPWLKFGMNSFLSYNVQNFSDKANIEAIQVISPLNPIRLSGGQYSHNYSWGLGAFDGQWLANPVEALELNMNRHTAYRGLSKLYGELKFLKWFTLTSAFGVDFLLNEQKEKIHPNFVLSGEIEAGKGSVRDENYRNANLITNNILSFSKTFHNDHGLNILLGQEAQILTLKYSGGEVRDIGGNPDQDQLIGKEIYHLYSGVGKQTLLSYFSQANYSFRDRYLLSASFRADGSSRFGRNERFGSYWSIGAGWVVSGEPLLRNTNNWLNFFKIRGSFGPAGNSAAITADSRNDYLIFTSFLNNVGVVPDRLSGRPPGNSGIQWEETFAYNIGADVRFLKERINLTIDLYKRKTKNLIVTGVELPLTSGFSTYTDNVGDLRNSGIELAASLHLFRSRDFNWIINGNWSRNTNKLTKSYHPVLPTASGLVNKEGEEYNSFYLKKWAGVNPANGRPQWIDSTTGKATDDYNMAKSEIVGKSQPDGFGSVTTTFSYKGFELSAMLYYQYGFQIYYNNILQSDGLYSYINQSQAALNRWQKPGDIATNPRRLIGGRAGTEFDEGNNLSTRFLYDGDFLRLSNVILSYTFPNALLGKFHCKMLKVFVQGHNLATWTKYSGQDPENVDASGMGNFLYPQQRSYTLGLNISF